MFYYSKSTNGFYLKNIHKVIPEDAIEISNEYHNDLMNGQAQGLEIYGDASGYPKLRQKIITPEEKKAFIASLRKSAYEEESDALYFKSQRGDGTVQEWQDKVDEIKQRYPYT